MKMKYQFDTDQQDLDVDDLESQGLSWQAAAGKNDEVLLRITGDRAPIELLHEAIKLVLHEGTLLTDVVEVPATLYDPDAFTEAIALALDSCAGRVEFRNELWVVLQEERGADERARLEEAAAAIKAGAAAFRENRGWEPVAD